MYSLFKDKKICAILRKLPSEIIEEYSQAVYQGGISMFEVALNSIESFNQITILRKTFENKAHIGAGTVLSKEQAKKALAAGAEFLLTPCASEKVLDFCQNKQIKILPGVMTPSDVALCLSYGITTMKLFPAGDLPLNYIKSLKGPFDTTEYVAVGGVNSDNIKTFMDNGFIGVGIGSSLIPKEYIKDRRWDKAKNYVEVLVNNVIKK